MRPLPLQSLVCNLFLLLVISCKSNLQVPTKENSALKSVENLYFSSPDDYVYKCQMDIYKHHISGIVIIKKIATSTHRVVMTTDFGNKMIDFELSENDFKLNYVLPDLDKKMVINFLKEDFKRLLKQKYHVISETEDDITTTYLSELDAKNTVFLVYNKENKNLLQTVSYLKKKKEKINFRFEAKKPTFAETIDIQHKDFKINIKLFQITENEN